jgi:hypothetical protein
LHRFRTLRAISSVSCVVGRGGVGGGTRAAGARLHLTFVGGFRGRCGVTGRR